MPRINHRVFEDIINAGKNRAEGLRYLSQWLAEGLHRDENGKQKISAEDISLRDLGLACGAIDPYDQEGSLQRVFGNSRNLELMQESELFNESNVTLTTNAFQVFTGQLLADFVLEGYMADESEFIGDSLVTIRRGLMRNRRIAGLTAVGGPLEVDEGFPYSETSFAEKYVTTTESKAGRIMSLTAELILFDQMDEIKAKASTLGHSVRLEREMTILQGVTDTAAGKYVYRPNGTPTTLYVADGSHYNYINASNTTSSGYGANVPLTDWEDIDHVLKYRATQLKDDRVDGTQRPLLGINSGDNVLLVPYSKYSVAKIIQGGGTLEYSTGSGVNVQHTTNPVMDRIKRVESSEALDTISTADWYFGNFKKQFIWHEIWPVQTSFQGKGSESDFDRDVEWRIKCRYYGGVNALDHIYVTKVKGA